ncbi:MAG: DUF1800 domain-containing protein [Bacteroidales bacterium]|nr:DUF1800 domain-containing protein [Bacteroidales bacterium]
MPSLNPLSGTLGDKKAAHLLRRATFGSSVSDIKQFAGYTAQQALDVLFEVKPIPNPPVDVKTGSTWLAPRSVANTNSEQEMLTDYFEAWWLHRMLTSGINISERIVWFLHSHLPVNRDIVTDSEAIYYQNKLFRHYVYGSYKELFLKICLDNAMLQYIDGTLNESGSPNENFVREMFELYTIGKGPQVGDGDYTFFKEQDVKAAAKVLTGYKVENTYAYNDPETGIPSGKLVLQTNRAIYHDISTKTFSASFGGKTITPSALDGGYATGEATIQELQELIDMIFDVDETARALCRKLYRFFVYHLITPAVETDIIIPLANAFKLSNYNLKTVITTLLTSQHFYDTDTAPTSDDNIGALIKSPLEIISQSLGFFKVALPSEPDVNAFYTEFYGKGISVFIRQQGLDFLRPFDVAGFDPYFQAPGYNRLWITPVHLAYRYRFSEYMLTGKGSGGEDTTVKLDIVNFVKDPTNVSDPANASNVVETFTKYLFAIEIKSGPI